MPHRPLVAALALLGLGACVAPAPNSIPEGVQLFQTKLFVEMSNGATCSTPVDLIDGRDAGRVARCETDMTYQIVPTNESNILRTATVLGEEGKGLSPILTPNVFVTLTKADGRSFTFRAIDFEDERDTNDDP